MWLIFLKCLTGIDNQRDKASTVFLKLYAKRRGKYKGWSDVRAETLPIDKSDIRN